MLKNMQLPKDLEISKKIHTVVRTFNEKEEKSEFLRFELSEKQEKKTTKENGDENGNDEDFR